LSKAIEVGSKWTKLRSQYKVKNQQTPLWKRTKSLIFFLWAGVTMYICSADLLRSEPLTKGVLLRSLLDGLTFCVMFAWVTFKVCFWILKKRERKEKSSELELAQVS
jgi:hypothetical protein